MRLDHLLSKEAGEVGCGDSRISPTKTEEEVENVLLFSCQGQRERFRWRCAWGKHPFSSRTRRLRLKRPMVLHRGRCGRAGGCRNYKNGGVAQLGEHLPCKQGVKSSNLSISIRIGKDPREKQRKRCTLKTEYRSNIKE